MYSVSIAHVHNTFFYFIMYLDSVKGVLLFPDIFIT